MNVHVARLAKRDALAFARDHDFHPERFLPTALLIQVCQFSYVVHLHLIFGPTYFAFVL